MSSFKVFDIAGSGMSAQNLRMNLVASNLANVDAVSSSTDATYRSRQPVFQTVLDQHNPRGAANGVRMTGVVESPAPLTRDYAPHTRWPTARATSTGPTSIRSRRWPT